MSVFDNNWSAWDLVRTLLDQSVQAGGVLVIQDDQHRLDLEADLEIIPGELPFDRFEDSVSELIDYRQRKRTSKQKRGRTHGTREMKTPNTIWLHQTAAMLAEPERFLSVPAHRGIDTHARVILLHPWRAYMYHGHAANRTTIGYEIACRAAGIVHEPTTFWRSKREKQGYQDKRGNWHDPRKYANLVNEATDDQIEAARALVVYDCEEVARQGGEIRFIGAHRQSHSSRVSDPGQRLWKAVGQWAIDECGLQPSREYGSGQPLPKAWTGEGAEPYSWRIRGY